jgi:hypothetical protein
MLLLSWKTVIATALCAVTCSLSGLAQVGPSVILRIEYENGVRYVYDSVDIPAFATVPTPVNETSPAFATYVLLADVVAVNGQPAKGIFLARQITVNLTPTPSAGQAIADAIRTNVLDRIVEIRQPDGTPIGSITTLGFNGGDLPPGAPAVAAMGGSFAVTGGTGAFLGVRGQAIDGGIIIANRNASVKEDPSKRRVNGGGKASAVFQLIPMSRPEVVATASGPAVFHADFSPVTTLKPAKAGEVLIARATGLGPTRPGIDPGQPFPLDATQEVNSPIDVTVDGKSADVINKIGWPGLVDTYRVDFRVPDGIAAGMAAIQLVAAWVPGAAVNIAIQ